MEFLILLIDLLMTCILFRNQKMLCNIHLFNTSISMVTIVEQIISFYSTINLVYINLSPFIIVVPVSFDSVLKLLHE